MNGVRQLLSYVKFNATNKLHLYTIPTASSILIREELVGSKKNKMNVPAMTRKIRAEKNQQFHVLNLKFHNFFLRFCCSVKISFDRYY